RECGRLQALGAGLSAGPPPRGHWNRSLPVRALAPERDDPAARIAVGPGDLRGLAFAPRRHARVRARRAHTAVAAAAGLFLAATLANGLRWQAAVDTSSHSTAIGSVQSLPLADGSRTVLGSDSRTQVL